MNKSKLKRPYFELLKKQQRNYGKLKIGKFCKILKQWDKK